MEIGIKMKLGTYERPKYWGVDGVIGDIYYYPDYTLFFRLKYNGSPSDKNWYYPKKKSIISSGIGLGITRTMSEPKTWREPESRVAFTMSRNMVIYV